MAESAYEMGKTIANRRSNVIYGGSKLGLMGSLAQGALEHKGEVVGIIPHFLRTKEVTHDNLTELIVVQNMHERKRKMFEMCDAIIALPGGFGTMEELFEMLTWAQIGLHEKPIGVLNVNGYYDGLFAQMKTMVRGGFLNQANADMVLISPTIDDLLVQMEGYEASPDAKWLDDDVNPF